MLKQIQAKFKSFNEEKIPENSNIHQQLRNFNDYWILGKKLCKKDHYDCLYTCQPKVSNQSTKVCYEARVVDKSSKIIAPIDVGKLQLINKFCLDAKGYVSDAHDDYHETQPVGESLCLVDICQDEKHFYLIHEMSTDDYQCMKNILGMINFSAEKVISVIKNLLKTIAIMDVFGISHLQLNTKTVLISQTSLSSPLDNISIKILNYGLRYIMPIYTADGQRYRYCRHGGKSIFVAPEVADGKDSKASDMWSVGVMLFYLVFNCLPNDSLIAVFDDDHDDYDGNELETMLAELGVEINFDWQLNGKATDVYNLIGKMMKKDPKHRVTAVDALKSPLFEFDKFMVPHVNLYYSLKSSFFMWDRLKTMDKKNLYPGIVNHNHGSNNFNDFSICVVLWKIYLSYCGDRWTDCAYLAICKCLKEMVMGENEKVTIIDALIVAIMENNFQLAQQLCDEMKRIGTIDNDYSSTGVSSFDALIVTMAILLWKINSGYLKWNDKRFQSLPTSTQHAILENICLAILRHSNLEKLYTGDVHVMKRLAVQQELQGLIIKLDPNQDNKERNKCIKLMVEGSVNNLAFFHHLRDESKQHVEIKLMNLAIKRLNMHTKNGNKMQMIQNILTATFNDCQLFKILISMLTNELQDSTSDILNFHFLYNLYLVSEMKNTKESQNILQPWLEKTRADRVARHIHRRAHEIRHCLANEVEVCPPGGLAQCIKCEMKLDMDDVKCQVDYCPNCHYVLCSHCCKTKTKTTSGKTKVVFCVFFWVFILFVSH